MTNNKASSKSAKDDLIQLINARIENLRPKLLDLTRRNPLLSTKFSDRSHSHIRVVDELPQVIFQGISEDKMRFIALPPLEVDPKDEDTPEFQAMLADSRLTDEEYIKFLENIDQDAEDSAEKLTIAERELKDRIRNKMGMPERQTRKSLSLIQHAKNNHILPSYDLPSSSNSNPDGRHDDKEIQTLLLSDMLEKRLNSIMNKCETWIEETGINVLRAAFGFLEWMESPTSQPAMAPLILVSVQIEKHKTKQGFEYTVFSLGEVPEVNTVLIEKLKREFGIELPFFNSDSEESASSLEDYFDEVNRIVSGKIKGMTWRIRRQVAIGVFPSARMAMYLDLDTKSWGFSEQQVIKELLGGKESDGTDSPFGEEYHIDDPRIEAKVPMIVTDVDSSQFSVIVDAMDEKNLAVEGPPGSGKSQTIVNTIAAALAQGKKVLFVAEKTAALEVVRSRLEACGLGEFLLTLQATRSAKEKVIESIRGRLDLSNEKDAYGLDQKIQQFQSIRSQLSEYIQTISSKFHHTNFTVHHVLGLGIRVRDTINRNFKSIGHIHISNVGEVSQEDINEIVYLSNQLETSWKKASDFDYHWSKIQKSNIDPYTAEEILRTALDCANKCNESKQKREGLAKVDIDRLTPQQELIRLKKVLNFVIALGDKFDLKLVRRVLDNDALKTVEVFFNDLNKVKDTQKSLSNSLNDPLTDNLSISLQDLAEAVEIMGIGEPDYAKGDQLIMRLLKQSENDEKKITLLENIFKAAAFLKDKEVQVIISFCDIASIPDRSVLGLRSKYLEAPDSREFILKAANIAKNLQKIKDDLDKEFKSIMDLEPQDALSNAKILSDPGFFYFLSPRFYKAKRFYQSVCKTKAFNKSEASLKLKEIVKLQENIKEFNSDIKFKELFGAHFNGCETNFPIFLNLVDFYEQIDTKLSGVDNGTSRSFLKDGDIDSILGVPRIEQDHIIRLEPRGTYERIIQDHKSLLSRLENLYKCLGVIKQAPEMLKVLEGVNCARLRNLSKEIVAFQKQWIDLDQSTLLKEILGNHFSGVNTQISSVEDSLNALKQIIGIHAGLRPKLMSIFENGKTEDCLNIVDEVIAADILVDKNLAELADIINVPIEEIVESRNINDLAVFLMEAGKDKEGLLAHSFVYANRRALSDKGYADLVDALIDSENGLDGLPEISHAVICGSLVKEVYKKHGSVLSKYDGNNLNNLRAKLAELDKQIIELSRKRLRMQLLKSAKPPQGIGQGRKSEYTEMALLRNEAAKKKRLIPVRELTARSGLSLLEIKPCWMMSPLAVAQYIQKGSMEFDLVIIDEASQMTPEDSIGALARGKRAMVVGDTNQLPPTPFFRKVLDDIDEDEDEAVLEESILEMANAVFRPARRLKWHYRSRHSGLIAFSNKYVYDSDLTVFPSPDINRSDRGVFFYPVKGLYSNGTNPIEAAEMVKATIDFMHKFKSMSLGIVLLNQKQQELVQEQLEYAIAHDSIAQEYVEKWQSAKVRDGLEKLFVKNLENVQGDERDVIFIGTVYGREKDDAPVMQRFGPINGIAGKRRLNVLFTRAKYKIVTFSSMNANDIRVDKNSNEGVYLFKAWLEYSASGHLLEAHLSNKEPGSVFEEYVISQLKGMGCEAVPQVGVAGYFIDIGVKHPNWPNGFIMGIECDGSSYHSSKSARDRDRLRQEILTGLGWKLYRIWSTDWFNDPVYESQRLREAIEKRIKELKN